MEQQSSGGDKFAREIDRAGHGECGSIFDVWEEGEIGEEHRGPHGPKKGNQLLGQPSLVYPLKTYLLIPFVQSHRGLPITHLVLHPLLTGSRSPPLGFGT